jgi:hypothetical protein
MQRTFLPAQLSHLASTPHQKQRTKVRMLPPLLHATPPSKRAFPFFSCPGCDARRERAYFSPGCFSTRESKRVKRFSGGWGGVFTPGFTSALCVSEAPQKVSRNPIFDWVLYLVGSRARRSRGYPPFGCEETTADTIIFLGFSTQRLLSRLILCSATNISSFSGHAAPNHQSNARRYACCSHCFARPYPPTSCFSRLLLSRMRRAMLIFIVMGKAFKDSRMKRALFFSSRLGLRGGRRDFGGGVGCGAGLLALHRVLRLRWSRRRASKGLP